jgi:mannose-6-phosphate isomerase
VTVNAPLRFEPYLRPMVWGGRRLGEVLGKALPTAGPYGEAWEVSDHPSHRSVVTGGAPGGLTLHDLLRRQPAGLLGAPTTGAEALSRGGPTFPWLIKFLDASDWLSVQVHPDEKAVGRLWPGEGPKNEAWFVLAAQPGSRIYAGLLPGVDEGRLRAALREGAVADCLHQFSPSPGDCLFLSAGTVHAVGGGVLMAEVQQTSDATFRLFDWNRRDAQGQTRTLHVEEALACIDWSAGPVRPVRADGYPESPTAPANGEVRQRLVTCPYFHLDYLRQTAPFACAGTGRLQALMVVHGRGSLRGPDGAQELRVGDTLLLPAALPEVRCEPTGPLGILLASLPPGERG